MTEEEWLACVDPTPMLELLRGKASGRKLRLFAVSCCRRIWDLLQDARSRELVEYVERVVDQRTLRKIDGCSHHAAYEGSTDAAWARNAEDTGRAFQKAAYAAWQTSTSDRYDCDPTYAAYCDAGLAAFQEIIARGPITAPQGIKWERERQDQSSLIRDIFGNPFRRVKANRAWRTSTVVALAKGIYEEKAFNRMPILADALQDAGCTNEDMLSHCRDTQQVHVRGCWVIDLVLGKS